MNWLEIVWKKGTSFIACLLLYTFIFMRLINQDCLSLMLESVYGLFERCLTSRGGGKPHAVSVTTGINSFVLYIYFSLKENV